MSGFDPEPIIGLRPISPDDLIEGTIVIVDGVRRRVSRDEVPVPLLPTEPGYYVAEADAPGAHTVVELLNSPAGQWVDSGDRGYLDPDDVRGLGPLVRLEPRAATAKAVLDRIASEPWAREVDLSKWRREFGVSS